MTDRPIPAGFQEFKLQVGTVGGDEFVGEVFTFRGKPLKNMTVTERGHTVTHAAYQMVDGQVCVYSIVAHDDCIEMDMGGPMKWREFKQAFPQLVGE